ncbi:MAG: DUF4340 domain-containing protein [Oscillospiraceae bacterium]
MKRSKRIYILLGVLAAACLATLGVMRFEEHKEKVRSSDEIILELPTDSITSLSWEYEDTSLSFHRDGDWLYDGDEAFPVDEEKIDGLLEQFQEFGVSFIIEDVEDFGQYGLENPVCTINIGAGDESYEILLGNFSNMDSERYVSIGDGNVYLVKNDPLEQFDAALSDLIAHDVAPVFENTAEIEFSGAESYRILYQEDSRDTYCADDVYFAQLDGKSLPLDTHRVENLLDSISGLSLKDYVTYNATDEELASCGLDSPELTISVSYSSENDEGESIGNTFVLSIGLNREEQDAANENSETGSSEEQEITAYVRIGDSQIIYEISREDYEELSAVSYDSLRHKEVLTADFEEIYQIDVSLEGKVYTVTSEEKDGERVYRYLGEEIDISSFKNALTALSANSFTNDSPTEKEEIGLTIYLNNTNYSKIQIELYRYDGNECLAAVNGETVSLIDRSQAVDLIEAVHSIVLR